MISASLFLFNPSHTYISQCLLRLDRQTSGVSAHHLLTLLHFFVIQPHQHLQTRAAMTGESMSSFATPMHAVVAAVWLPACL